MQLIDGLLRDGIFLMANMDVERSGVYHEGDCDALYHKHYIRRNSYIMANIYSHGELTEHTDTYCGALTGEGSNGQSYAQGSLLRDYGWQGEESPDIARVSAVFRERFELICAQGETRGFLKPGAFMRGDEPLPTVGDFVRIEYNPAGDSRITGVEPRRTYFARRKSGPNAREQAVAANFDYVLLATSLNGDFNLRRMERYLTAAYDSGAVPVVLLTKADLCAGHARRAAEVAAMAPGVDVHVISALTGQGMDALARYVQPGITLALLGSSGVGKSSLINALAGSERMRVNHTRSVDSSKGRHTTTHRQLLRLPGGALIIDTPGMRELGIWCAGEGLDEAFADVSRILERGCRFSDCTHEHEPGCAVREALLSGELSPKRWQSYQALQREAQSSEMRKSQLVRSYESKREIALMRRKSRAEHRTR